MGSQGLKDAAQLETLRKLVGEACLSVLSSTGVAVTEIERPAPAAPSGHDFAGFIGFTGAVRGSLLIAGPADVFRATYPVHAREPQPGERDLSDWAGEMANQILGGVKRRFCDRGRDIETSTPTVIQGRELGRRVPARARDIELMFALAGAMLTIHFELIIPSDGRIFPDPSVPIGCSREGDVVLF